MAKWLKLWLIAVLAFHAAVTVMDGRRCSIRGGPNCGSTWVTACNACGPCGSPATDTCTPSTPCPEAPSLNQALCQALCGEDADCPEWLCLLCRCDDPVPPVRQQLPEQPKHPAPAKPAFIERQEWHEALAAIKPTVSPRLALSPPARLAVICIWRL